MDYALKREKCKTPEELEFKTKPQLAIEMFRSLQDQETLPFKYIVADSIYGNSPEFIESVENCIGATYFVSIPYDTLCWPQAPITRKKEYKYKGKISTKQVVEDIQKCFKITINLN